MEKENKKYRLLVIALYCYTGHVKGFIEHLKKINPLVDITLLSNIKPDVISKEISDPSVIIEWYDVKDINYVKNRWLREKIIRYKQNRFFAKFAKNRKYDIVNIHFPKRHLAYAYKYLRKISSKIVISPWGSDILRQTPKALTELCSLYQRADFITTINQGPLGRKIQEEFNIEDRKFVGGFLGSDIVDFAIENGNSITQEDAKKRFGLSGRYVITCGYNRKVPQRHKAIIEAIQQVRDKLPANLTLLFPMTYANPKTDYDYVQSIKQLCEEKGIPAVFVTEFLSVEDVYKLRKSTDIFVHVQTTDAGASSVLEYILCNKKVVHGAWMKYDCLEAYKPLFYFPVEDMETLGATIVLAYNSEKIEIPQGVKDYVISRGWNNRSTMLNEFFMSIL